MIREIIHDPIFLARKSEPATKEDIPVAADLLETLAANADRCVGMAANMIGVSKCVIAFDNNGTYMAMFNPVILKRIGKFETEEGCLSLSGVRKTTRYKSITVKYQDMAFKTQIKNFTGWTAQIIQHEVDHCEGILI